ncbi:class I SAM-dependent methyltransferase [soil metagenome]
MTLDLRRAAQRDVACAPRLVCADGHIFPLYLERWLGDPSPEEAALLGRVKAPVLDIGCGPGRHVVALARRGVLALGIDIAESAVHLAQRRGALVIQRCVFERVPGAGRWGSALLLAGNVGIGGDPIALLRRTAELLGPRGRALVELEPPGTTSRTLRARIENGAAASAWFPWSVVGAGNAAAMARGAGFEVEELWDEEGRWFASLAAA